MLRSLLISALAAASFVKAQSNVCSADSTTISSDGDLAALGSCTVLDGDLIIGPGCVQPVIGGIENIKGSLIVAGNTQLTSLSAPQLNAIGGTFNMTGLIVMSTCSFPSLKSVETIFWETLPALQQLTFTAEVTQSSSVTISDTFLTSLDGINLVSTGTFNINNNKYLKEVNVQLANVSFALAIEFNAKSVVASFPNLIWAANATFRDVGSVGLASLQAINNSMEFDNNTFTSFSAPNLTTVGQALSFVDNSALTSVSFPLLTTVGGTLQFANNSALSSIMGFPALATIGGAIDFSGDFTNATLPSLQDVRGGFNLQTTENFDCSGFQDYKNNGTIKGNTFTCDGAVVNAGGLGTTPTTTGASSTSTGKHSAAGQVVINTVGLLVGAFLSIALVL